MKGKLNPIAKSLGSLRYASMQQQANTECHRLHQTFLDKHKYNRLQSVSKFYQVKETSYLLYHLYKIIIINCYSVNLFNLEEIQNKILKIK